VTPEHDAIVLAGGRGRRLGGASKPDVILAGRRLIDRALDAAAGARRVVVVAPAGVAPEGVLVTLEDPPGGGPVAGLAAGLAALPEGPPLVLVLACDVPRAARAVRALAAAFGSPAAEAADGVVVVDPDGRVQPLLGFYRRERLEAALDRLAGDGGIRGASMRRLLEHLRLAPVVDRAGDALDVDTWSDLDRAERAERGPISPPP
jgi:molybdopterin-guanine dinucleotide biosynthesis protein A